MPNEWPSRFQGWVGFRGSLSKAGKCCYGSQQFLCHLPRQQIRGPPGTRMAASWEPPANPPRHPQSYSREDEITVCPALSQKGFRPTFH